MSAPAVVIRIDFESQRPSVVPDYLDDGDRDRMNDWLAAHPDLLELVLQALALERAA